MPKSAFYAGLVALAIAATVGSAIALAHKNPTLMSAFGFSLPK